MQQDKEARTSYFFTLTYDTNHVPITPNGYMTLKKEHLQLFYKRVRYAQCGSAKSPIKYYAVGEYGDKYRRPHYHALIFNLDLAAILSQVDINILNAKGLDGKTHIRASAWPYGTITIGSVAAASVGYTLKYMCKDPKFKMHERDDRIRGFSLMSKGLGKNYLSDNIKAWHKADLKERMYVNTLDGKKVSMPRYYKDKLYTESERQTIADHHAIIIEEKYREEITPYMEANKMEDYVHDKKSLIAQKFALMYKKQSTNGKAI